MVDANTPSDRAIPEGRLESIRRELAAGRCEAQLRLRATDAPVSNWVATVEAFDAALAVALSAHARTELYVYFEGDVD